MTTKSRKQRPVPFDAVPVEEAAAPVRMAVGERKRSHPVQTTRVPIGIEKLLYLAATKPEFRKRLLGDRERAIAAAKVRLTEAERSTLLHVPPAALEAMIARISPARHGQRKFMKTVAAASVSLAAGVLGTGCVGDDTVTGIRPDVPDEDVTEVESVSDIAGDTVLDTSVDDAWTSDADAADVDVPETYGDAGIGPDGAE